MFILINRLIYLIKKFKDRNIPIQQYHQKQRIINAGKENNFYHEILIFIKFDDFFLKIQT